MKKAVITMLGLLSHTQPKYICNNGEVERSFEEVQLEDRANYLFSEELSGFAQNLTQNHYINTLPLLIDVFKDRDIIPIATPKAKMIQEQSLKFLAVDGSCLDHTVLISESNYEEIFQKISELLQNETYESFIIDLTHGFRHLPILMIVNLIIASIKDVEKIEHIFFAKEIVPFKEYKIIDLLDYIDLAKLSFVLENFNTNYTVGNKLVFRKPEYQGLVNSLQEISEHILANSIKRLLKPDENLIQSTIDKLQVLQKEDTYIATFSHSIGSIIEHLGKIEILKDEEEYIKLFKFAEVMQKRDYLLNSITLLNESIGMFCIKQLMNMGDSIEPFIKAYQIKIDQAETNKDKKEFNIYKLSHQSKNIIKLGNGFKGEFLSSDSMKRKILDKLREQHNQKLIDLIDRVGDLRNNLAHGNSSDERQDVESEINSLLKEYQTIARIPNTIDLKAKEKELREKALKKQKMRKPKAKPTGIDAPREEIDKLQNIFNGR